MDEPNFYEPRTEMALKGCLLAALTLAVLVFGLVMFIISGL
jgi:hypothetical protein